MSKNTKKIPAFILIIATLVGSIVQHFKPQYQLIFLGIILIVLIYGILELKSHDEQKNKIGIVLSFILFGILCASVVIGKNYGNMNENTEGIVLLIAFVELFSTLSILGYRIVNESGDSKKIRQFVMSMAMLVGLFLLLGLVALFAVLGFL
ncbi:hypothetical protein G9F72_007270 [Clostridium estertheticum]|uniref:hypothetical protein n=1 Tax=Clostridium estertheticum TaxID=238834 RepID=UPI0013E9451D|nr:hypothetical protein [Clostridium estertheticum]MBZ9686132.1 hypothetical protein [Clostridium estertheticum]